MTSSNFFIRIVRHYDIPEQSDHLDCFIDPGENQNLITYELDTDFLQYFKQNPSKSIVEINEISSISKPHNYKFTGAGTRKHDHRRKYLKHSGEIRKNSGFINEIATGKINTIPETKYTFFAIL